MDPARLRDSFEIVRTHGDHFARWFYADLFVRHPDLRDMFPVAMDAQRRHLLAALAHIVAAAGRPEGPGPYLGALGVTHRKFGVAAGHYPQVAESLLAALEHFCGDAWTPEAAADWAEAYTLIAGTMTAAAAEDEQHGPAWRDGTVTAAERRTADVTVLHVSVAPPLAWLAGQHVTVQTRRRPRLWRPCAVACPPGEDMLEFHVRAVPGGEVSPALAALEPGEPLRVGPAAGTLRLDPLAGRDLVMAADSTGLAPLKAILRQAARQPAPPLITLLAGGERPDDLYDMEDLRKLAARSPWLTVIPVAYREDGPLDEALARCGDWAHREAFLAGPPGMITAAAARLASCGTPPEQVHTEEWSER